MTTEQWYWVSTPRATFGVGETDGVVTSAAPIAYKRVMGLPIEDALALYPGADIVPLIDWAARKAKARAFVQQELKRGYAWAGQRYDWRER